jgi:hypothetical protein
MVSVVVFWVVTPYSLVVVTNIPEDYITKTLVTTYKTAWHPNPEDHDQQLLCCENLESYIVMMSWPFLATFIIFIL